MENIKKAISHFNYGVKCDIFQEPVTSYAKMAISALEKQIPKKVNNLEVFSDIGACVPKTKSGNCPICNNFMIGNHTYCNDCGQALDWSDTE